MIKEIKILGERNSGTNWLRKLLKKNIDGVDVLGSETKGWKHGLPESKFYKNMDEVLFVCIIRDIDSWLMSMYKNPYHLQKNNDFHNFITTKLEPSTVGPYREKPGDAGKDIFELRYYKIRAILDFFEKANNIIVINLESTQKDKGHNFVEFICDKYNLKLKNMFSPIEKHTKVKNKNIINRSYDININDYKHIIDENKSIEIEEFVYELKENYKYKSK